VRETLYSLFITGYTFRNTANAQSWEKNMYNGIIGFFYRSIFYKVLILILPLIVNIEYLRMWFFQADKDVFAIPMADIRVKFCIHLHTRVIAIECRVWRAILFNWECNVCPVVTGTTRATTYLCPGRGPMASRVYFIVQSVWVSTPPSNVSSSYTFREKKRTGIYFQSNIIIRCDSSS